MASSSSTATTTTSTTTTDSANSTPPAITPSAAARFLGVRFTHISPQRIQATFTVTPDHLQPAHLLHGGVMALIGEEVASVAAQLNAPPGHSVVGSRLTLNHLSSAVEGDVVHVTATPLHVGRKTHLWTIRVEKEQSGTGESRRLLSTGDMQAFVKQQQQRQPPNQSKL